METRIEGDIDKAQKLLEAGQLVAIPTETVYGLAANAFNSEAIAKIFEVKNRPVFDPLIVHIGSVDILSTIVTEIHPLLRKLMDAFWPGPLTVLLPKTELIPDLVTSGLPDVGVRMPKHEVALALLKQLNFPLAAPSANPFGYISPTSSGHVIAQLGGKIPYILEGGECSVGVESTVVGLEHGVVTVFRLGGLSIEKIEEEIGMVALRNHSSSNPVAPGQLESHYAPRKPFYVGDIEVLAKQFPDKKIGALSATEEVGTATISLVLSKSGDLNESAQRLFGAMRELDTADVDIIIAELLPETGLGRAINDRLKRAGA